MPEKLGVAKHVAKRKTSLCDGCYFRKELLCTMDREDGCGTFRSVLGGRQAKRNPMPSLADRMKQVLPDWAMDHPLAQGRDPESWKDVIRREQQKAQSKADDVVPGEPIPQTAEESTFTLREVKSEPVGVAGDVLAAVRRRAMVSPKEIDKPLPAAASTITSQVARSVAINSDEDRVGAGQMQIPGFSDPTIERKRRIASRVASRYPAASVR